MRCDITGRKIPDGGIKSLCNHGRVQQCTQYYHCEEIAIITLQEEEEGYTCRRRKRTDGWTRSSDEEVDERHDAGGDDVATAVHAAAARDRASPRQHSHALAARHRQLARLVRVREHGSERRRGGRHRRQRPVHAHTTESEGRYCGRDSTAQALQHDRAKLRGHGSTQGDNGSMLKAVELFSQDSTERLRKTSSSL